MKTNSLLTLGIKPLVTASSLMLAWPTMAIERPDEVVPQKVKPEVEGAKDEAQPEQKLAMLGLGGAPVSKTLAMHLGLEQGTGLTLFHIVPDSAAAKAGLQAHDVMTHFDGAPVGNQEQLREQIFKRQPGDEVDVKYIHKGKPLQKKIVLGERPAHLQAMRGGAGINPKWMFQGMGGDIPEEERQRIEKRMKQQLEMLQKHFNKEGMMELKLDNIEGEFPDKAKAGGFQMNAASSITISDEKGSITINTENGKKDVLVRDKEGKVVFEGPYDTPQDKASVPDDIRERVEKLNLNNNGKHALKLRIMPGGGAAPPVPHEDEDAQ